MPDLQETWLVAEAPLGAFKSPQGGSFRSTYPVMPPTAAWGLILNIARIHTNLDVQAAGNRKHVDHDRPDGEVAIGLRHHPTVSTLLTHSHSYPVGSVGKENKDRCHGTKYWISPVTREILVDLAMVIGVRSSPDIARRIIDGLDGTTSNGRHNVPYAGECGFAFSRLEVVKTPPPAIWYTPIDPEKDPVPGTCALPVRIDFADSAKAQFRLFCPTPDPVEKPPLSIWIPVSPS